MRTKLSQFNFELPEELVAKYPSDQRDESRLMVVHKDTGKIEHKIFKDLIDYFDEDDVMIFNNTKVFPARLYGTKEKTGARIEVFLLRELNKEARLWDVLVDPARKIRVGNKLYFSDKEDNNILIAEVVDNTTSRGRTIRFLYEGTEEEFHGELDKLGTMPLPKYLARDPEPLDIERYQTIYAKNIGAVAAPTAGLHVVLMWKICLNTKWMQNTSRLIKQLVTKSTPHSNSIEKFVLLELLLCVLLNLLYLQQTI